MRQKTNNGKGFPLVPVTVAVTVILLAVVLNAIFGGQTPVDITKDGVAYLELREAKDPGDVILVRRELAQAKLEAQREEMIRQVESGEMDPFAVFQDYCIMGDSRAVGFWYFGYLDKTRCLTGAGHTIRDLAAQMEDLVAMNPGSVYLCYGLNDTSIGYWASAEEYVREYMDVLSQIRQKLPETKIIVSSILPARDPAFQRSSKWRNIPEWSAALERACESNGILFANCDQLAEDHPNLWDPDGIHFREQFYPYWASCLVVTLLMEGAE